MSEIAELPPSDISFEGSESKDDVGFFEGHEVHLFHDTEEASEAAFQFLCKCGEEQNQTKDKKTLPQKTFQELKTPQPKSSSETPKAQKGLFSLFSAPKKTGSSETSRAKLPLSSQRGATKTHTLANRRFAKSAPPRDLFSLAGQKRMQKSREAEKSYVQSEPLKQEKLETLQKTEPHEQPFDQEREGQQQEQSRAEPSSKKQKKIKAISNAIAAGNVREAGNTLRGEDIPKLVGEFLQESSFPSSIVTEVSQSQSLDELSNIMENREKECKRLSSKGKKIAKEEPIRTVDDLFIDFLGLMERILGQVQVDANTLYQKIKKRTDEVDLLMVLISKINNAGGKVDWSDDKEMQQLIDKAREIGVEIPEGKYTWEEEELLFLKDNIQMVKEKLERITMTERTNMQRLLTEESQIHQIRANILKLLKDAIDFILGRWP